MKVKELIAALLEFDMDGEVAVSDRTSWDAGDRIMRDPSTHPDVAWALAFAAADGYTYPHTNVIAEVVTCREPRSKQYGDAMIVITGRDGKS